MSAWIVSQAHIDVLVQGLCESEHVTDRDPDDVGRTLWRENLASVAHRYPRDADGERPGPVDFHDDAVNTYIYRRPARRISPEGLLNAIGCYDYQSCEHPGWETSQAYEWVNTLAEELRAHPNVGQPNGPWGYEEKDVH